jgi:hypothetical protein
MMSAVFSAGSLTMLVRGQGRDKFCDCRFARQVDIQKNSRWKMAADAWPIAVRAASDRVMPERETQMNRKATVSKKSIHIPSRQTQHRKAQGCFFQGRSGICDCMFWSDVMIV